MEFESVQEEYLKALIKSTKEHIDALKKTSDDAHFYQVRLEKCNTYICDDIEKTIKILTEKLKNYKETLKSYSSN
tara:strand:- start:397 stop:621 length:225 start_codon:yes stop_codon:yes gene_type:complete